MRILILGATGMLGHRLMIELSKHHEVWGTTRGVGSSLSITRHRTFPLDIDSRTHLGSTLAVIDPEVVINCIAAIPQSGATQAEMIATNAEFPHRLANLCDASSLKARLIHFSTDGVFSGAKGDYTEDDTPDATDVYGMTKRLGEISDKKHVLTLRCCPIGREIGAKKSLVEWFLAQTGTVKGYTNAWFNPLTAHEIAHMLNDYVFPDGELHGLYHVGGAICTKGGALHHLNRAYAHNVEIISDDSVDCDRTLVTMKFYNATGYNYPAMDDMLAEMAADNALYEGEHAHG